jgi:hypothetical protein
VWVVVGVVLRLILMPLTAHPDIRGHYLGGYILSVKNQYLGVYDYISRQPRTDPLVKIYGDDFLVYSPLTYWVHGLWLKLPFYSPALLQKLFFDYSGALADPGHSGLLLFLKLPYLGIDLLCLWLLLKFVDAKNRVLTALLWAINLPLIYSAYLMGQFDIFIVVFMLVAAYFAKLNRPLPAAVALAISSGFKPFGLFMLPFLPGNRIKNILVGVITYGAIIAPYALTSPAFRMYALSAQQSDKVWFAKILVSGSQSLPLFMVGCVVFFWLSIKNYKLLPSWAWLATPLLVFYSVTQYHPQWFAWISPLLILALVLKPAARWGVLTMLGVHLAVVLSFDKSLNFGLFGLNYSLQSVFNDGNMSLARGVLAGTSLTLPWFLKD